MIVEAAIISGEVDCLCYKMMQETAQQLLTSFLYKKCQQHFNILPSFLLLLHVPSSMVSIVAHLKTHFFFLLIPVKQKSPFPVHQTGIFPGKASKHILFTTKNLNIFKNQK